MQALIFLKEFTNLLLFRKFMSAQLKRKNKMGWKNWPYWLRAGVIGIALYILILTSNISILVRFLALIQEFFQDLFLSSSPSFSQIIGFAYLFSLILAPILWFLIAALIGFIIGKIKSKNQKGK